MPKDLLPALLALPEGDRKLGYWATDRCAAVALLQYRRRLSRQEALALLSDISRLCDSLDMSFMEYDEILDLNCYTGLGLETQEERYARVVAALQTA